MNPLMSQLMLAPMGNFSQMQDQDGQAFGGMNPMPGMPPMGLPNMGNLNPMAGCVLSPTVVGQSEPGNQGDLSEVSLLPALLPLLQSLNLGRGDGRRNGNSGSQ